MKQEILQLIRRGALFVVNHSGGKDSQAMAAVLAGFLPKEQVLFIHADLAEVEWPGTQKHARDTVLQLGYKEEQFLVAKAGKTFFEMVDKRQNWPSPKYRQCTSDLKRGPIEKAIRNHIKANNLSGLVVNCMGLRAQESDNRACGLDKQAFKDSGTVTTLRLNKKNSKAGREWYDWLPIHNFSVDEVWAAIENAGQVPHPAYALGSTRLSCAICIMGSKADLRVAAQHNPELYAKYVAKEKEVGKTVFAKKSQPISLEEYTGIKAIARSTT